MRKYTRATTRTAQPCLYIPSYMRTYTCMIYISHFKYVRIHDIHFISTMYASMIYISFQICMHPWYTSHLIYVNINGCKQTYMHYTSHLTCVNINGCKHTYRHIFIPVYWLTGWLAGCKFSFSLERSHFWFIVLLLLGEVSLLVYSSPSPWRGLTSGL